jgi:hypothetical protein
LKRLLAVLALLAATAATSPPSPPAAPSLTFFADRFYRGAQQSFTHDEGDIRTDFTPRSVRARGRWLVCSDSRFRGRCIELDTDYPVDAALGLSFNIRSLRSIEAGRGAAHPAPGLEPGGPSLAGLQSRYFTAPLYGTERALACPDGAPSMDCAKETAQDLCRRAGYRQAAHFTLDRQRGLYYLADVLCTKP